jgi:cytoskeleton protein RodZ
MAGTDPLAGVVSDARRHVKTGSPTVVVSDFPCAVCGARLDRLHLDPGPERSFICSFCGAPQPDADADLWRNGSSNGRRRISLVEASDVLREARERRGESLEQVAGETGINPRYLEDLEGGDASFEPYPGRVYGRFFLREYAEHLGLDPEPMVEAFDGESAPVHPLEPSVGVVRTSPRSFPWSRAALLALVLLLVGAAVLRAGQDDPSLSGSPIFGTSTRADVNPFVDLEHPPAREAPVKGIRAVAHVSDRTWIDAISDGTTTLRATKEAGAVVKLRADRRLELTLGNAGGVRLIVNGHRVATGASGDVVDLVLDLRGDEVKVSSV